MNSINDVQIHFYNLFSVYEQLSNLLFQTLDNSNAQYTLTAYPKYIQNNESAPIPLQYDIDIGKNLSYPFNIYDPDSIKVKKKFILFLANFHIFILKIVNLVDFSHFQNF